MTGKSRGNHCFGSKVPVYDGEITGESLLWFQGSCI